MWALRRKTSRRSQFGLQCQLHNCPTCALPAPCPRAPNANSTTTQRIVTETYPLLVTNPRNINLSGQRVSVNVTSGLDTLDQRTKFEAKQSGVTVALSSSVLRAVQGAAYNTYNQAKNLLKEPGKATDISVSVSVSLGSSKSSASSQDKSTTAVGSQVVSAGSVNVTARNPKPNPDGKTNTNDQTANAGNIVIEGSQVIATEDINLNADRDITLLAAGNTSEHRLQRASPCSWPRRARRRAFAEGLALVSR